MSVNRFISPRPVCAFWFDLPATTASIRKPGDVDARRLVEHIRLYHELHSQHDAIRINAEDGQHEVAASIAHRVWRARNS